MANLSLVNKKISEILRNENNEVVYTVWLSCTEDAEFEDNNIIIKVPNHYLRETFENKYKFEVETLYRKELNFSKLIVAAF